jgi:hypothetical protein
MASSTLFLTLEMPFAYRWPHMVLEPITAHTLAECWNGPQRSWVSTSNNYGSTWSKAEPSNMPMPRAKAYLGKLSTGQLYLLSNLKNRGTLVISVSKPNEETLSKMWRIRHGKSVPPRYSGKARDKFISIGTSDRVALIMLHPFHQQCLAVQHDESPAWIRDAPPFQVAYQSLDCFFTHPAMCLVSTVPGGKSLPLRRSQPRHP